MSFTALKTPARLAPAQIRGARAMLDWSMVDLARAAGVSVSTVKRVEDGHRQPVSDAIIATLRQAFEAEGMRFLPDEGGGIGLRMRERAGSRAPEPDSIPGRLTAP